MAEQSLVLNNVSKIYPMGQNNVTALDNINLEIKSGELITLLGPSGAGKTTLLNLLGGIDSPTSGEIYIFNELISELSPNQLADYRKKKVGFVFQFFNLLPSLTALENVEISIESFGKKDEIRNVAIKYLEAVGLGDRLDHIPSELSGGQQQRVTIARALVKEEYAEGKLLILMDEPTGNVDEETGDQILKLVKKIALDYNATFIVVTHNPLITQKLQSREIHIRNGKIVNDSDKPLNI
ncbi:MAG: ABC transporter ATP-binding protein [Candidatus Lokiarchaeota archaeon]|nr:ABC transporter ATP-binding protein [Candidatus Lokiarchaeota archaeon]